jgi:single-stranded-DNA-specific exonuclease
MKRKKWKVSHHQTDEAGRLAAELQISPLLAQLLLNRGISRAEQAVAFLNPDFEHLYDPFRLPGVTAAVERLMAAIATQQRLLVYGDYDADGVTAIALIVRVLAGHFPGRLLYYVPKRLEEGYGLHLASLERAVAKGIDLVVTVDCGISAVAESRFLKEKGIDLIITDHHEPSAELPEALAIIDPKLPGSEYPFTQLAGVGVAFKLLQGLTERLPELREKLLQNLDLVAFGTVADIVPLLDENRILVKFGLEQMAKTTNTGLQALLQAAGFKDRLLNCSHISYILAPRINAAGRMGNSGLGVKLLLTSDPVQAFDLARELERENQNRQETEALVFQEVQAQLEAGLDFENEPALVLSGADWHPGVIGIVASKLVDMYFKPVILVGFDGEEGRGSGRSVCGFNLFEALQECSGHLVKFGGHELAAGLTVKRDQFPAFKEAFLELARQRLSLEQTVPILRIESLIDLERADLELARELARLAPCGTANPTPVLACRDVNLVDLRGVGENGKHLKIKVGNTAAIRDGIGFNMGALYEQLHGAAAVDLAFALEENIWNGTVQVQLNLRDIVTREEE